MLWKLSLTGIKSRLKDYIVLFSGLTLAAAIFYMFLTLALNPHFLKKALPYSDQTISVVFGFGTILLALITLVYLTYANSFLLSMRKRTYGMYMMLGARNAKIGHLIFAETLVVGLLASILGIVIGIVLTQLIAKMLISQLGLIIHYFLGFYWPAALWTLVFFTVLFFLAALFNRVKLTSGSIINLIHAEEKPVKLRPNKSWQIIEVILGLGLLATGYWAMANYRQLRLNSIPVAFVTIVLGSYFTFSSFFTSIINLLEENKKFAERGLRSFTLGQLKFRISSYHRILTVVSLLFALALGAITVGLNFNHLTDESTEQMYYDAVLPVKNKAVNRQLKKLSVKSENSFTYKIRKHRIYVSGAEIDARRLKANVYRPDQNEFASYETRTLKAKEIRNSRSQQQTYFLGLIPAELGQLQISNQKEYERVKAPKKRVYLLVFNNFKRDWQQIKKVQQLALIGQTGWQEYEFKIFNYEAAIALASGFEFMGFFLGIAFLAMLASTLMFKVLSGATSDQPRYQMLKKIGATTGLLRASIAKEIGVLFALPAVLGVVDVLFGLQFFKMMLKDPYDKIWLPFTIFLLLYLLYYFITFSLYQGIVLKKR